MKKQKINKDEWEAFDDCAICQVMKNEKGENANVEDLIKAFQKVGNLGVGKVGIKSMYENQ